MSNISVWMLSCTPSFVRTLLFCTRPFYVVLLNVDHWCYIPLRWYCSYIALHKCKNKIIWEEYSTRDHFLIELHFHHVWFTYNSVCCTKLRANLWKSWQNFCFKILTKLQQLDFGLAKFCKVRQGEVVYIFTCQGQISQVLARDHPAEVMYWQGKTTLLFESKRHRNCKSNSGYRPN